MDNTIQPGTIIGCAACGGMAACFYMISACVKMHITDQYVCKTCISICRMTCPNCHDSICDYAIHSGNINQTPHEWYTSWGGTLPF